jgi:hypothetical protein
VEMWDLLQVAPYLHMALLIGLYPTSRSIAQCFLCLGENLSNFDLINMNLTYYVDFQWKNGPNLSDFNRFFFQIARFL